MKRVTGILFAISVFLCGCSSIIMMPLGLIIIMGISESYDYSEEVIFTIWFIVLFSPWVLASILFYYLGDKNATKILDKAIPRTFNPQKTKT